MAWTENRLDQLKALWSDGFTATQIAEKLGGVSRNAVIGKAHRLGLKSRPLVNHAVLLNVHDLPIGRRTQTLLINENVILVGDLAQKTEASLLRIPNFGRHSLNEVKSALANLGLRTGMSLEDWPPASIARELSQVETFRRVSQLRQAPGGATFQPLDNHFVMAPGGDENDLVAAQRLATQQMQSTLLQKARSFEAIATRLDNQIGWSGIGRTVRRLAELLDREPLEIPEVLGFLYPVAIELGSFVELDQQLAAGAGSYAAPLDPEVRRPLSDLVRNLSPWLRSFPSIREADDEASRFLVQAQELEPTLDVVRAVENHSLLIDADLEVFHQLLDAANRGAFLGEKAGGRAKRSASNFVIGVAVFAGTFFSGAVSSDYATTSPLVHKVGQFLVQTETSIAALLADSPQDLRYSIIEFVKEFPDRDPVLPSSPPEMIRPAQRLTRRRKQLAVQKPQL